MKKSLVIILAALVGIMLIAAGCTSSSGTAPATTPSATTTATTAAPIPSVPATVETPAPVLANISWSGTWNTSYSSTDNEDVIEILSLTQAGSTVTGTYGHGNGTISAAIQAGTLAGTWSERDDTGNYSGQFEFVQSADEKSFTGRWTDASEGADALLNTTQYWNGVRV